MDPSDAIDKVSKQLDGWKAKLDARGHAVYFIDPLELNLPLLDRMYKEMEKPPSMLRDFQNKIKDADDIWRFWLS